MSLQSERIQLLMERLSLTEMVHGYEALAEQRSAWLRKQTEENLALEIPVPATFTAEPLSAPDCN